MQVMRITVIAALLAAWGSSGCTSQEPVRLYVFDCGSITLDDVSAFGLSNDDTAVRELFVPCYLIEHPRGRLVWDGGLPLALAGAGPRSQQAGVTVAYERSFVEQLEDMGLTPADIDLAAYSHFHFDHVGAANAFRTATLLIQQSEYEAAFMHPEDNPVFDPALYAELKDSPRQILEGDHDVFGDGRVRIIYAPGHTPGHQTLLLDLARTGRVMLSGDLYHFQASRRLRATPEFNTDAGQTVQSMDRIEALLAATGATLWIEHDKALADRLQKAPAFYD